MIFKNTAIDITALPSIETATYQRLAKNYVTVRYISNTIFFIVLLMGIAVLYRETRITSFPILWYGVLAFWVFLLITSFFLIKKGYELQGYVLRDHDILHRKGVLVKSLTTIPFNRVQHCEISQGPIQRIFDLYTLEIFTAGGGKSDLSIPGLEDATAQRIKEFILKKTHQAPKETSVISYSLAKEEG